MSNTPFLPPLEHHDGALLLRAYRPGDGAALRRAAVPSYEHLRPWMPWARAEQSEEESEALCRRFAGNYLLAQDFVIGIWLGDELAGGTGFHPRGGSIEGGSADIGMWISAAHAGRGLGTRALAAMLAWGFGGAWPWQRLTWHCDARNHASAHLAQKGGMRHEATFRADALDVEGKRRDTLLFALLREEWEATVRA
jgi:RimJ/RimL family protein N-acetyltransferase